MNISIINDESIEGNETFTIYLTSDVGVNVSPYVQTEVTIIDDDKGGYDNGTDTMTEVHLNSVSDKLLIGDVYKLFYMHQLLQLSVMSQVVQI